VSPIILNENSRYQLIVNFFDAGGLTDKDRAEINPFAARDSNKSIAH